MYLLPYLTVEREERDKLKYGKREREREIWEEREREMKTGEKAHIY